MNEVKQKLDEWLERVKIQHRKGLITNAEYVMACMVIDNINNQLATFAVSVSALSALEDEQDRLNQEKGE